ncbi:carboxylesterase family protein [Streptomyces sp. enrichment culture]|uniref:carboxylesterase family protein n=1 Tax=Streptomyces sp. enrichment culture TaxID=1795815 RepID=UPI003F578375
MRPSRTRHDTARAALTALGLLALGLTPLAAQAQSSSSAGSRPVSDVVQTTQGKVRGTDRTGYDAWLGIPYADAGRWEAPRTAAKWSGVRDATSFGDRCAQNTGWDPGYEQAITTEDCLDLNVYVPDTARAKTPVLVWIHGGGFTGGAGQDTNPRTFVTQTGTIVVTINYRLGVLGTLNLPQLQAESKDGPGNYGLLDQQAALRWVHSNISRFGGDPDNVTIAGQSAGAGSVCDHLASPTAKGLFSRAVIMSGGCNLQSAAAGQAQSTAFVVDDLGYLWDYLGQTLPYDDDQLELSRQMIGFWGRFTASGDPNGPDTPAWPRFSDRTGTLMSLVACDTSPASGDAPAACSKASRDFPEEHNLAFWQKLSA